MNLSFPRIAQTRRILSALACACVLLSPQAFAQRNNPRAAPTHAAPAKPAPQPAAPQGGMGESRSVTQPAPESSPDNLLCDEAAKAPDKAIPACTRLIETSGAHPVAASYFLNRGAAKTMRGDYSDAIADFSSALDRDPNLIDAYRNRALVYFLSRDFDKAVADYSRAIKIAPKSEALYDARGAALFSKGEYGSAIEDANRALALNKNFATAYLNRGLAYQFTRKIDNALKDFSDFIRLAPEDARGYANRAFAKMDKADFDGAIADYTLAIQRNPKLWMAYSGRGEAHRVKGDFASSEADHNRALEIEEAPDAYLNRALLRQSRSQFAEAIADCDAAILADPRHAMAYAERGAILTEMRDVKRAMVDLDKAVSLTPDAPVALTWRGTALREAGRLTEAIGDFDRALRAVNDFLPAYTGRGLVFERQGDLAAARRDYQKAVALPAARDYAVAKPAQDLAKKRLAALDEQAAADAARAAQTTAEDEAQRRAEAEKIATLATNERRKFEAEAAARQQAEAAAREAFQTKVRAEANAEIAQRTRAAQERIEAEMRMKAAADARERAEFEARVKTQAEAQAKAEFDARLQAEVAARQKALEEAQAKTQAEARLQAQAVKGPPRPPERRIALVIGNSNYPSAPLANPSKDAQAVAQSLRSIGFADVTVALDLTRDQFVAAVRKFEDKVDQADWALIYYAGHGMSVGGRNYLIPIDASLKADRDIPDQTVSLDRMLTAMERARKLRLVVLDACRDNPFAVTMRRTPGVQMGQGLSGIEPDGGTLVAFAAREGRVALDGRDGNSPFTSAFLRTVGKPGLEVNMLFRAVRDQVVSETRKMQEPVTFGSLSGESFYFVDN